MADLEVNAATLARDGDRFNNMASIAYSIYGFLANSLSLIDIPEDDEVSRLFSEQWNSLVGGTRDLLMSFHGGMKDVASRVSETAAFYALSNQVSTESIPLPPTIGRGPAHLE